MERNIVMERSDFTMKNVGNYATVKEVDGNKLTAIASTATVDRDGEIIMPSAFAKSLDTYRKNPVILASHVHRSTDGTPTIIGSANSIEVKDDVLEFSMTFANTPLAKEWQSLYDDGHAKAFSVGFIPKDGEMRTVEGKSVWTYTEVELMEISAVGVPSNPDALARGIDSKELERLVSELVDRKMDAMAGKMIADWVQRLKGI